MSGNVVRVIFRFLRAAAGVALAAYLSVLLLCLNALQILSLLLKPFSPDLMRRFNRELANGWWGMCVLLGTRLLKYDVVVSGDRAPRAENALVFGNHQEMPDIFVVMVFAFSKGRLGDLKFFAKDIIKWVPGIGWGMWVLDCVFLKRNWAADEDRIRATFHRFTTAKIPFWLTFFPEGTRIRPEKLKRSQQYAREKGLPVLQHLLTPRTKGFTAAMTGLRSEAVAVYDLTIAYEKSVPTLWSIVVGSAGRAHLHVRRFPISELPSTEPELARWLIERFVEKDELLARFNERGTL